MSDRDLAGKWVRVAIAVAAFGFFFGANASAEPTSEQRRAIAAALDLVANNDAGLSLLGVLDIADLQHQLGDPEGAAATLARARAMIEGIRSPAERDRRSGVVAVALARHDRNDEALGLARRIRDLTERMEALRDVAAHHAEAGRLEQARATWALMPRGAQRDVAIDIAAQGAVNANRYDIARLIARENTAQSTQGIELAIALNAARHRRFRDALTALANVSDPGPRARVLYEIGSGFNAVAARDDARRALREARVLAERAITEPMRGIDLGLIGTELAYADAFAEALEIAARPGVHEREKIYRAVCARQASIADYAGAEQTLVLIPGAWIGARRACSAEIIAARVAARAEPIDALSRIADPLLRVEMVLATAAEARASGDFARAEDLLIAARNAAASIEDPRDRDRALDDILHDQGETGFVSSMRETVALISNASERASAFAALGQAQMADGADRAAAASFQEALRIAGPVRTVDEYASIIEHMAEVGLMDEALVAARALPRRGPVEGWARDGALVEVAAAYARAVRYDEAFAAAAEIEHASQRLQAYLKIVGRGRP